MQWADVIAPTPPKVLRQFAVLSLLVFGGLAASRAWHGDLGLWTRALAALGLTIGALGLWRPTTVRFVYVGWMAVAFPIGWTVSRVIMAALFFLIFTPIGLAFRALGRDSLRLRPRRTLSYWTEKAAFSDVSEYFRQS